MQHYMVLVGPHHSATQTNTSWKVTLKHTLKRTPLIGESQLSQIAEWVFIVHSQPPQQK